MYTTPISAARSGGRIFIVLLAALAAFPGMATASVPSASAQSSTAQLRVTGLVQPAACTVNLAGYGIVDYGTIPKKNVPDNGPLIMGVRHVQFSVNCEDPMIITVTARDERPGTAVLGLVPGEDQFAFGLGSIDDTRIGQFRIQSMPGTFFGQDAAGHMDGVDILYSYAGRPKWARSDNNLFWANGDTRQSFGPPGTLVPRAYRIVTGAFQIDTRITRRGQLPGGNVPLAGLATIEIFY